MFWHGGIKLSQLLLIPGTTAVVIGWVGREIVANMSLGRLHRPMIYGDVYVQYAQYMLVYRLYESGSIIMDGPMSASLYMIYICVCVCKIQFCEDQRGGAAFNAALRTRRVDAFEMFSLVAL